MSADPLTLEMIRRQLGQVGRGALLGLGSSGTSVARGLGRLPGLSGLGDWADTTDAEMRDYYEPQGTAGTVGTVLGSGAGAMATMLAGGAGATAALRSMAPGAAATLAGLQGASSLLPRLAGQAIPAAPTAAVLGAGTRSNTPGREAALNVAYNTPLVGDALSALDAGRSAVGAVQAAGRGQWADAAGAAGMTGLAALGVLPFVGALRAGKAGEAGAARSVASALEERQTVQAAEANPLLRAHVEQPSLRELGSKTQGRRAVRNTRGGKAIARVRDMEPEDAMRVVRAGGHLKQMPDGQYVGAPRGVTTPALLGLMRRRLDALIEEGAQAGDWYHRARQGNVELAGPDPARQRLLAQEEALWSSQADPDPNLGLLLLGHNAYEAGTPLAQVRTKDQGGKYITARDEGAPIALGPKQGPYSNKLDPTQDVNHIPTNDFRQFQLFGYTDTSGNPWTAGGTKQMHAFVDGEMLLAADRANQRKLAGRTDWDAASIQAAPWIVSKAQSLQARFPKRFPTFDAAFDEAKKTYPDHFGKYTAYMTSESIPGASAGHLPGLVTATPAQKADYTAQVAYTDEAGRDVMSDALGLYQRGDVPAQGVYTNSAGQRELNPQVVSRPLVAKPTGGHGVDKASLSLLHQGQGLRAYLDAQEMGAAHKLEFAGNVGPQRSLQLEAPEPLDADGLRRLTEVADGLGFEVAPTGGRTVTLINRRDIGMEDGVVGPANGVELGKALKQGLLQPLQEFGALQRARFVGTAWGFDDAGQPLLRAENAGTGRATQAILETVSPAVQAKLDGPRGAALRAKVLQHAEVDAALSDMGPVRDDVQRARRIFAERGFTGLREALRQSVALPAAFLTALGAAANATAGDSER